ncbi:AGAP000626-PA-like protein [Anopheles sinensis]|uniref:AGAP000626-PA-like protein n=1 Tax=Anopheles sinensis TaxID=74873 RepID=A0A084VIV9_ANOSI|nr:AGAP000626-PA-like protein [Anopheles sinensis]
MTGECLKKLEKSMKLIFLKHCTRPFRTAVASYMRLTNPTDHDICFKIKTTAPKKYCVRPNCGILEPKESQEIAIVLQPFIFDANEKNKHKFMVQSMVKPDDEDTNLEDLWKKYPEKLMDSKLRCVFEVPLDSSQPAQQTGKDAPNSQKANAAADNEMFTGEFVSQKAHNTNHEDEPEDENVQKELKKLRDEERALRQENLELKEQVLRLRLQADGRAKEQRAAGTSSAVTASVTAAAAAARSANTPVHYTDPYSPPPQVRGRQHMELIMGFVAIFTLLFGVLIGKFTFGESSK